MRCYYVSQKDGAFETPWTQQKNHICGRAYEVVMGREGYGASGKKFQVSEYNSHTATNSYVASN